MGFSFDMRLWTVLFMPAACSCRIPKDTQPGLLRAKDGGKKLMDLGLQFIPMEQIIRDSVESLKSRGDIS